MQIRWRHNLVTKFFLRITVVLVLMCLLADWLIIRHYAGVVEDRATTRLAELVHEYADFGEPLSAAESTFRQTVMRDVTRGFATGDFLLLTVFDENRVEVAGDRVREGDAARLLEMALRRSDDTFPITDSRYEFVRTENDGPLVCIFAPLRDSERVLGYLRAIGPVDPELVDRARSERNTALWAVSLTIAGVLIFIFPLIFAAYRRLNQARLALLKSNMLTIIALTNAIAKRDADTAEHNYRVTLYSIALGEKLKLSDKQMQTLIKGSILHDVGKIGIRDDILLKPGKLDEDEFEIMKGHVEHGADIIGTVEWLAESQQVILYHHEKFDGSGYGTALKKGDIPLLARIFAIVDVFDALSTSRPYKEPYGYRQSIAILQEGQGSHFDPELLDTFLTIAGKLHREIAPLDRDRLEAKLSAKVAEYFGVPL